LLFAQGGRAYNSSSSALTSGGFKWSGWGLRFCDAKTRGLCEGRPGLILPGKRRATRRATIDLAVVSVRETAARFGGGGIWNAYDDWKPEVSGTQSCRLYFCCSLCFFAQPYCDW
jgi:hypothetical protein